MSVILGSGNYRYRVIENWAKLPDGWEFNDVGAVAVDSKDQVYVFNRGEHPMCVFDREGNVVHSWGGPGAGFDWPTNEHGIYVDPKGYVWIGGNDVKDHHILKFTRDGKFLLQIGKPGKSEGSNSRSQLGQPAAIESDAAANEIYVGDGYGNKSLPFFKNYFAGGVSSLRGYRLNTVSPRDANGDPRGGNRKLLGNVEYLFPFPGLTNDKSVRLSAFVDGGGVSDGKFEPSAWRYSTGMALAWVSPFGPMKFSVAAPLVNKVGDRRQVFQFTFGGAF